MSNNSIKINSAKDIMSVVNAHMAWKKRIQNEINGDSDETLAIENIIKDNLCVLGKWIYSEGEKSMANDSEFIELKQIHARFHEITANTLVIAQNGQSNEAQEIISHGEFADISKQVVKLLTTLYKRYK